jgi:hypothetical protein
MATATLESLTEVQRHVYNLVTQQEPEERIARTLDTTLGVVKAQITRIRNKGILLPGDPGYNGPIAPTAPLPNHINPERVYKAPVERPQATGGSNNDQIADALRGNGQALNSDQLAELAAKVGGNFARDIHPMVLMGVTMQFVKLCGGRMTAHQVIEDVYSALRTFCVDSGMNVPADKGGETQPMPQTDHERLALQEEQIKSLRETVASLKARLGS